MAFQIQHLNRFKNLLSFTFVFHERRSHAVVMVFTWTWGWVNSRFTILVKMTFKGFPGKAKLYLCHCWWLNTCSRHFKCLLQSFNEPHQLYVVKNDLEYFWPGQNKNCAHIFNFEFNTFRSSSTCVLITLSIQQGLVSH